MSKHMTIINLACTITKLRKWGEAWKHSAESAQAATARMHQANKDLERAKVITDGLVDKLIADRDAAWTERDTQAADHSRQLAEHRAAFGARTEADAKIIAGLRSEIVAARMAVLERDSLMSERDGLLTQVQDMRAEMQRLSAQLDWERAEIKRLQWENATMHKDAEDGYAAAIKVLGDPVALSKERDALRAEVAALKSQNPKQHPVKVGEWVRRTKKCAHFGHVAKVLAFIEPCSYEVQCIEGRGIWYFHNCEPCDTPEATHAEPDLTQLHAKGKEAWSDVPNATQWVEEMRGNSEATHDTVQGKAAAESAVRTEPVADEIKVGDVAKVVGASGDLTAQSDIGKIGEVLKIDFGDGTVLLSGAGWVNRCDVRKVTT